MRARFSFSTADLAVGLLTSIFGAIAARFVWQPVLASFADDSVSYLVMAQVFSPWQAAIPPVAEAFSHEAFYPPLFPALLGLLGAAHDTALAHAVTALMLAACLPLVYVLGIRWLGEKWAAAAVVLTVALLPSLWIHVKGVLSEPLFSLLLLATLCVLETKLARNAWLPALAMAALALTRTVGLAMVAAHALWAVTRPGPLAARMRALLPALAAAAAYATWVLLRPAETSDVNVRIMVERLLGLAGEDALWAALWNGLLTQANALAEAWVGALMLFWVEGRPVRVVLAGAVGFLALAGMAARLAAGKADGWMLAAYLVTFLLWPFHDQMTRFLFPVLPVLFLYAFWALAAALRAVGRAPGMGHALLALVALSLSVPALAFIQQRASSGGRYAEMTDWYRRPDLDDARARSQVHLDLLADMELIKSLTGPEARVMWVAPSYIALLAERRGVRAPQPDLAPAAYRAAGRQKRHANVFLSVYHPRDTLRDAAWRAGIAALSGRAQTVHARPRPDGAPGSLLLKPGSSLLEGGD